MIDRSILPRADGIGLLLDLAIKSNIIPSFLEVQGVHNRSDFPLFAGGFGDVWRANLGDKVVALKTPRVGALGAAKIHKVHVLFLEMLYWLTAPKRTYVAKSCSGGNCDTDIY